MDGWIKDCAWANTLCSYEPAPTQSVIKVHHLFVLMQRSAGAAGAVAVDALAVWTQPDKWDWGSIVQAHWTQIRTNKNNDTTLCSCFRCHALFLLFCWFDFFKEIHFLHSNSSCSSSGCFLQGSPSPLPILCILFSSHQLHALFLRHKFSSLVVLEDTCSPLPTSQSFHSSSGTHFFSSGHWKHLLKLLFVV